MFLGKKTALILEDKSLPTKIMCNNLWIKEICYRLSAETDTSDSKKKNNKGIVANVARPNVAE